MASVDGARTLVASSDETFTNVCGPCHSEGFEKQALRYCEDCEEFLCFSCEISHKRFKSFKAHTILSDHELPSRRRKTQDDSDKIVCVCESNKEAIYFCCNHEEVFGQICMTIKHRKCNTSLLSETDEKYSISWLNQIQEEMQNLSIKFEEFESVRASDLQKLQSMNEECLKEMQNFRKEINQSLDTLEQNTQHNLDKENHCQNHDIKHHIDTCSTTTKTIKVDSELIEHALQSKSKEKMFETSVKVSGRLKDYKVLLSDIQLEAREPFLFFEINTKPLEMLNNVDALGYLRIKEDDRAKANILKDRSCTSIEQVNLDLSKGKTTPWITGCIFIPNGEVILCDFNNKLVIVLDRAFNLVKALLLSESPWDVSIIDEDDLIVSCPNGERLQIIRQQPSLTVGRVIKLGAMCWGLAVVGNQIYVSCHRAPGDGEIRVISHSGNLNRIIGKSLELIGPSYISVSTVTGHIFVSDWKTCLLSCLKPDAQMVYQYSNPDLHGLKGIYVDEGDNVVVCGRDTDNVYIVSSDGKEHKTILPLNKAIPQPCCVAYRPKDRTLLVGSYKTSTLSICKF